MRNNSSVKWTQSGKACLFYNNKVSRDHNPANVTISHSHLKRWDHIKDLNELSFCLSRYHERDSVSMVSLRWLSTANKQNLHFLHNTALRCCLVEQTLLSACCGVSALPACVRLCVCRDQTHLHPRPRQRAGERRTQRRDRVALLRLSPHLLAAIGRGGFTPAGQTTADTQKATRHNEKERTGSLQIQTDTCGGPKWRLRGITFVWKGYFVWKITIAIAFIHTLGCNC